MADAEARGGCRVQMAVPTQLWQDNPPLWQPCHVVLALLGTHTCAGRWCLCPFLLGAAEEHTGCLWASMLAVLGATFSRGDRGSGSAQGAEPTLCTESLSSLRGLFVSGAGKWVVCQESAAPWLRFDWHRKWAPPIHVRVLLNISH